MYLYIKLYH